MFYKLVMYTIDIVKEDNGNQQRMKTYWMWSIEMCVNSSDTARNMWHRSYRQKVAVYVNVRVRRP